ncbi:hypothetical protein QR98_0030170 [Sarcoptes scabiei]|uniref:C3H1-type domain-containing protein n=1 Tax=Sarcoptes scabiei TaxID=52283 RepID=A0A132A0T4_SARSC|nr:hypothetical protein QR98_0030170 [Sarcoptes scabiei]
MDSLVNPNNNARNSCDLNDYRTRTMAEKEEGEILEDGEIADDDDDDELHDEIAYNQRDCRSDNLAEKSRSNDSFTNKSSNQQVSGGKIDFMSNHRSTEFGTQNRNGDNLNGSMMSQSGPPMSIANIRSNISPQFKCRIVISQQNFQLPQSMTGYPSNKGKKKIRSRKRKRSDSLDSASTPSSSSKKHSSIVSSSSLNEANSNDMNYHQRDVIDISPHLNDSSFDQIDLSDENEFNFNLIEFDVFMEILGCEISEIALKDWNLAVDKSKLMARIVKIIKSINGNDPDTARRFARLKRRSREKLNRNESQKSDKNSDIDNVNVPSAKPDAASNSNGFKAPCRFYLEGKCHKGNDCTYSHSVNIPKRKELCKFYLQGFCGKGDDCLFMHSEFPCKFFHTNTKCYAGENCRFSHKPLSDEMREVLRNYLDSGTFPDEVKPYRPINHVNEWNKDDDPDSNDYDFEVLLSKPRRVLLGSPTEKMKTSLETWQWQQNLKEAEKAYTGSKKNLFTIDDACVIAEKPPTPRIEDDEDEIEAHIRNYYNDILDTDDFDEMLHVKEFEELEQKLKHEMQLPKAIESSSIMNINEPMSEEEKRLIEASALDEDLRILPQAFTLPPAFQNVSPPSQSSASSNSQIASLKFDDFNANNSATDAKNFVPNYPTAISGQTSSVIDISDSCSTLNQSTQQSSTAVASVRDPRIRDPRLNNSNRIPFSGNNMNNMTASQNILGNEVTQLNPPLKSEIKIIKSNPNLVIEYKLFVVTVDPINYSDYLDLFESDSSVKHDPRLQKFFTPDKNETDSSGEDMKHDEFQMSKNINSGLSRAMSTKSSYSLDTLIHSSSSIKSSLNSSSDQRTANNQTFNNRRLNNLESNPTETLNTKSDRFDPLSISDTHISSNNSDLNPLNKPVTSNKKAIPSYALPLLESTTFSTMPTYSSSQTSSSDQVFEGGRQIYDDIIKGNIDEGGSKIINFDQDSRIQNFNQLSDNDTKPSILSTSIFPTSKIL